MKQLTVDLSFMVIMYSIFLYVVWLGVLDRLYDWFAEKIIN